MGLNSESLAVFADSQSCRGEDEWLLAWQCRHEPSTFSECDVALGESHGVRALIASLHTSRVVLPMADLAQLSTSSKCWYRFVHKCVLPTISRIYGVPPSLPMRSLRLLQCCRVYDNFEGSAAECWERWRPWGHMEEDEPQRVLGAGSCRLQMTRAHPDTGEHFGRGVQRWLEKPVQPVRLSIRVRVERPESDSFYGGAVGYVILGDRTPSWQCGSRFGHEAVFMYFVAPDANHLQLQLSVGRAVGLSIELGANHFARWMRVELALDWQFRSIAVSIDGKLRGAVVFRTGTCAAVEHITLLNYGGPAATTWSEVALQFPCH